MNQAGETYVQGDIRGIQDYIFASPRLLEMRGASALIDFFDRSVIPELTGKFEGDLIYSGGGNFLAIFKNGGQGERVKFFTRAVRTAFLDLTGGHGLVVASVETTEDFPQAMDLIRKKIQCLKRQPEEKRQIVSWPFLKRCESCGRETADHPRQTDEKDNEENPAQGTVWLGPACIRKRNMHAEFRAAQNKNSPAQQPVFVMEADGENQPSGPLMLQVPSVCERLKGIEPLVDFKDLLGDDDLAILVADGNGLGAWFDNLKEAEKYRNLSERVDSALREALKNSIDEVFPKEKFGNQPRLQVLICGGDDLVIALPSRYGVKFSKALMNCFEVEDEEQDSPAGISIGLAICPLGFPFRQAHHLAEELLGQAKARCRKDRDASEAADELFRAFAFHRVTASHVQSLEEERSTLARDQRDRAWSYGAAGPYTFEELSALLALKEDLEKVSKSQRGRLREILSPRDDGKATPLDEKWQVPARVVQELRYWLERQKIKPFQLPQNGSLPTKLVRTEQTIESKFVTDQRFILADALVLAGRCEG